MESFFSFLEKRVDDCSSLLCIGLDPHAPDLPEPSAASALDFCLRLVKATAPYAAAFKPNAAFFEFFGPAGWTALKQVIEAVQEESDRLGSMIPVILDAKRGDIASTATAYADAAFGGCTIDGQTFPVWDADALTVNPYLGRDAVEPFLVAAKKSERGVFVLVRTSNPGAGLFQDLMCDGTPVYRHVAEEVAKWNAPTLGASGLGDVGAVVGATHPKELAELRAAMPDVWLLVPGYGAQGGTAADVKAAYRPDGLGAIVNSSRGVTFPFHPDDPDWETKIVDAAKKAQAELKP
jgi:orotidine-5'-phosphate decarboxylase